MSLTSIQQYHLSRIEDVKITEDAFKLPSGFDLNEILRNTFQRFIGDYKNLVDVKIRFDLRIAPLVLDHKFHELQQVTVDKRDKALTLTFPVTDHGAAPEWRYYHVRQWVLQWGGDAEVLEPPELRELVEYDAGRILDRYRKDRTKDHTSKYPQPKYGRIVVMKSCQEAIEEMWLSHCRENPHDWWRDSYEMIRSSRKVAYFITLMTFRNRKINWTAELTDEELADAEASIGCPLPRGISADPGCPLPYGISLRDAYTAVFEWCHANVPRLQQEAANPQGWVNASGLVRNLPHPQIASDLEAKAVLSAVICGRLEWAYHLSDGNFKMAAYAHTVLGNNYSLTQEEKERISKSRIAPYLYQPSGKIH